MSLTFYEEILFDDDDMQLQNLYGNVNDISRKNLDSISGLPENQLDPNDIQKITIKKSAEKIDGIFIKDHSLTEIEINRKKYTIDRDCKLIIFDDTINLNLEIIFKKIKQGFTYKKIGTLIILKKIEEMKSLPLDFSFKLKTIGNTFKKSKGGTVKVVYGIKAKYRLSFVGISSYDINILKKMYFYNKYFFMCIFPEKEDIQEQGLQHCDFYPLIMTGDFNPRIRSNILNVGQDIDILLEEA